ncbi:class I SAM-dependent methyltransferase [Candidatus Bathyarchaeota archaeon]|nr:MAG: class I SAM-dependent methyltransferase [Candidatus Bathyarchaeota archaeon]
MIVKRENAIAWKREQRAKEAVSCLGLTGHDLWSGLLLDLGCGEGFLTGYFLKLGMDVVGLDRVRIRVKLSKERAKGGNFVLADGTKTPFKAEIFKTVILNDVLEHVTYDLAKPLLNEIKRIMKVNGKLYISVANRYQIREPHTLIPFLTWLPKPCWNVICKLIKKRPYTNYYPYTIKKLRKLCREVGLIYRNYTWFYAWNKISNIEHIGDPALKKLVNTIRKFKLSKLAYPIAEKVSIILFICEKDFTRGHRHQ